MRFLVFSDPLVAKCVVDFSDVTSEESPIIFNVYDRGVEEHGFLGTVQIKPILVHDHTVDEWYKYATARFDKYSFPPGLTHAYRLRPFENEVVSGDMRVQITFEQYKVRALLSSSAYVFRLSVRLNAH